jgi:uncharacterized phiE125 gp8 family phage protein
MRLNRVAEADGGLPLSTEAVTLASAKEQLSVFHDTDDTFIEGLCRMARALIEGFEFESGPVPSTGVAHYAITRHVLDGTIEEFPNGDLVLCPPPLISVSSVKYYDANDSLQVLSSANYRVVQDPFRSFIRLKSGYSWPSTSERPDAVTVRFTVGSTAVPQLLDHAMKLLIAHYYVNREIAMEKSLVVMPMGFRSLVERFQSHGHI